MNLSTDLFEQIVGSFGAGVGARPSPTAEAGTPEAGSGTAAQAEAVAVAELAPEGGGTNRRRDARVGVRTLATVIPFDAAGTLPLTVEVRDLSPGGVGFMHTRKMSLDEQFVVLLPSSAGTPVAVLCSVAYWQQVAAESYVVGARFTRVLRQGGTAPEALDVAGRVEPAAAAREARRAAS